MKKILLFAALSLLSCKKKSKPYCNCGIVMNKIIVYDLKTYFCVDLNNTCYTNSIESFCIDSSDWNNLNIGDKYCIPNQLNGW